MLQTPSPFIADLVPLDGSKKGGSSVCSWFQLLYVEVLVQLKHNMALNNKLSKYIF